MGSLVWGYAADRYGKRKSIMLFSYLGSLAVALMLFLSIGVVEVIILYGLYGFVGSSASPIASLLLTETCLKQKWALMFSRLSLISQIGIILGMLPGGILDTLLSVRLYFIVCVVFAGSAALLTQLLVSDPPMTLERRIILRARESFTHRLLHPPIFFLKTPRLNDFKMVWRSIKSDELPLLYGSMFLYFTGVSIYFTSLIPYLKHEGFKDGSVSALMIMLASAGAATFTTAGKISQDREEKVGETGLIARALCMFSTAFIALNMKRGLNVYPLLTILIVMGIMFSFIQVSTSTIVLKTLRGGKQGEMLGVYSAATGLALFIGALTSGYLSYNLGYVTTFTSAGLLLVFAYALFKSFERIAWSNVK